MEATTLRKIESGIEYEHLFPKANLKETTVKRNANLTDTIDFIPRVVHQTQWQTKKIAAHLQGKTLLETCSNIWHFVYQHINYQKDKDGFEQIRSPARAWHDRKSGVDCDCYSVFISTILSNLHIPHQLRITKYGKDFFQHIYPIVPIGNGKYITIDCVVNQFNFEEPFTEKKDYNMDLQFLNGINDDDQFISKMNKADEELLFGNWNENDLAGDLGRFRIRINLKDFIKKGLHFINRINPAAVLLRNGVLICMKLNFFKVAQRLKWAYLTPEQAQQKGIILSKYHQLVKVKEKLEKIFYGAGGNPDNFRKSMLSGKGNKNRDIALFGLGYMDDAALLEITPTTTVEHLLGTEMFHSENVEGLEDFQGYHGLGEPISASAAIASASGAVAAIAAIIKGIGNIFHPEANAEGAKDFSEQQISKPDDITATDTANAVKDVAKMNNNVTPTTSNNTDNPDTTNDGSNNKDNDPKNKETFWDKNKKWIKPAASVAAGVTLFAIGYMALKPHHQQLPPKPPSQVALSGTHSKRKSKKQQRKTKKKAVALM